MPEEPVIDPAIVVRDALLELARPQVLAVDGILRAWHQRATSDLLVDAVAGHGLSSTLHDVLVAEGIDPPAPLVEARRGATARRLASHAALGTIGDALDGASVPWAVLKGPVVAALHPRPEHREFNDVDVLVAGRELGRALDALVAAGVEDLNENWVGALEHGVAELPLRAGVTWIDLHWHVVPLARARRELRIDVSELLERRGVGELGGRPIPTLDPTDQVLHLGLHAGLGGAGVLAWLRDLAVVIESAPPDWAALTARARSMGAARLIAQVLDRSRLLVGAAVPPGTIAALGSTSMLGLRRRLDDRAPEIEQLRERIAPAFVVKTARDGPVPTLTAIGRVGGDRLSARMGRPRYWDVDDERSPLHWGRRAGGAAERQAYLAMAGRG